MDNFGNTILGFWETLNAPVKLMAASSPDAVIAGIAAVSVILFIGLNWITRGKSRAFLGYGAGIAYISAAAVYWQYLSLPLQWGMSGHALPYLLWVCGGGIAAFVAIRHSIRGVRIVLCKKQISELEQEIRERVKKQEIPQAEIDKIQKEIDERRRQIRNIEGQIQKMREACSAAHDASEKMSGCRKEAARLIEQAKECLAKGAPSLFWDRYDGIQENIQTYQNNRDAYERERKTYDAVARDVEDDLFILVPESLLSSNGAKFPPQNFEAIDGMHVVKQDNGKIQLEAHSREGWAQVYEQRAQQKLQKEGNQIMEKKFHEMLSRIGEDGEGRTLVELLHWVHGKVQVVNERIDNVDSNLIKVDRHVGEVESVASKAAISAAAAAASAATAAANAGKGCNVGWGGCRASCPSR